MPISAPEFVRGKGVDAVDEFKAFVAAVGRPAVDLLAELVDRQNFGTPSEIPVSDGRATKIRDLYVRPVADWTVFYTTTRLPFRIIVLHVSAKPFVVAEAEAERRLRQL